MYFFRKTLIMDGQILKKRIEELTTLSKKEIASRLNVSDASLSQYFEAKDVKSGLIEKLCEVLDVDLLTLYGIEKNGSIVNNGGDVLQGHNVNNNHTEINQQVIDMLRSQLDTKDEQIGKLIDLLNK